MHSIKKSLICLFAKYSKSGKADPFKADLKASGIPFSRFLDQIRNSRRLYVDLDQKALGLLKMHFRSQVERTVADADRVMSHTFDLLGSGPFVPVDSHRSFRVDGYVPIDWYFDPVQKLRFPKGVSHKEWDLYKMRPGNADIKLPWELARCQHFVTLGQAFRLTGDQRYALEILYQIDDFMDANPVGLGINWTCTMDVAIRAANWAMSMELIRNCQAITNPAWYRLFGNLFSHGEFIFKNFENNYEVTSNHYLSNIVGLYFLSTIFAGMPSAKEWQGYCRESIINEIETQILEDGVDFESSIPYHRLVLELFLGAARIAEIQRQKFPDRFYAKLLKMSEFLSNILRPDGLIPVVGDADDGRLHIFSDYGGWNRQDCRHVLAPASFMLNKPELLKAAGPEGKWEAAWWGYDVETGEAHHDMELPDSIHHYPNAGISVMRSGNNYMLITNSIVGTKGFGNHKHNDQLSIEFHCDGVPLIIDPGSHVYTSDFESRNKFRSTAYHNTLQVDGLEQNDFNPEWIFRMFEKADPEHVGFQDYEAYIQYIGRHSAYQRLSHPLIHTRCLRFLKRQKMLVIMDLVQGEGMHDLRWHFHFAPNLKLSPMSENMLAIENGKNAFFLSYQNDMRIDLQQGWYSPSYGIKRPCSCVDLKCTTEIETLKQWCFAMGPSVSADSADFSTLIEQHHTEMSSLMAAEKCN